RPFYDGNFFGLLSPFALLSGLISLSMLVAHGGALIALRTQGAVQERGRAYGRLAALAAFALFGWAGLWVTFGLEGYLITSTIDTLAPSNPLAKTVITEPGAWLANYSAHPWMMIAPVLGLGGMLAAWLALGMNRYMTAFLATSAGIFGIISTAGL